MKIREEWKNPTGISPQEFETNDGKWGVKISDEGFFELWYRDTDLSAEETFGFCDYELEIIISLLTAAREINPHRYETIQKFVEKEQRDLTPMDKWDLD